MEDDPHLLLFHELSMQIERSFARSLWQWEWERAAGTHTLLKYDSPLAEEFISIELATNTKKEP